MVEFIVRVIDCHVIRQLPTGVFEFLILKRSTTRKLYPNTWQCVAGKIEQDERPENTAYREFREETGLNAKAMWTLDRMSYYYDRPKMQVSFIPNFLIEAEMGAVKLSDEHSDSKWLSMEDAQKRVFWKQQAEGIAHAYDFRTTEDKRLEYLRIDLQNL